MVANKWLQKYGQLKNAALKIILVNTQANNTGNNKIFQ